MITDVSKYVDFLTRNKLTEHQFLMLWLVHTKDKTNIIKYKNTFGEFKLVDILDLIDRGWINDFGIVRDGVRTYNIYDFLVTDRFTQVILIDEDDAYEELCKNYVKFIEVKGTRYPAITGDPVKLSKDYWKAHKGNRAEHERIVELTKRFVNDNKIQKVKIENYIKNQMWKLIEESTDGPSNKDAFTIL
jgi:hypothetical protein